MGMFRETMEDNSRYSYMYIPSSGYAYNYYRTSTGGSTGSQQTSASPRWVRIVREGNVYTSYTSTNGITWSPIKSVAISMGSSPYACLVASSRSSARRGEAIFSSASVMPYPWIDTGLGNTLPGSSKFLYDQFTVTSGGTGITGTSDSGEFLCQTLTGDGSISARVLSVDSITAQAGVMFRKLLSPVSQHAYLELSGNQATLQTRALQSGATTPSAADTIALPTWIRLVREGDVYTGFLSSDGINWTLMGSSTVALNNDALACLASSSSDALVASDAMYERVSVLPAPWTMNSLATPLPDYAGYDNDRFRGRFTVVASGSGMDGSTDIGSFVCHPFDYDGSISARVISVQSTTSDSMGGVIVRESMQTGSVYAYTAINPTTGAVVQSRSLSNQPADSSVVDDTIVGQAYWVRVVREGNSFTQFISPDSVTWTNVG